MEDFPNLVTSEYCNFCFHETPKSQPIIFVQPNSTPQICKAIPMPAPLGFNLKWSGGVTDFGQMCSERVGYLVDFCIDTG